MRSLKAVILLLSIVLLVGGVFLYFLNKSRIVDLTSSKFKGNYKLGELLNKNNGEIKNFSNKKISFQTLSRVLQYSHNNFSDIKIYLYIKKNGVTSLSRGLYYYIFKNNQLEKLEKDINYSLLVNRYKSPVLIFIGSSSNNLNNITYFKSGIICENLILGLKDLSLTYRLYLPEKLYSLNEINIIAVIYAGYNK